jgi:hypothetical protein
VLGSSDRGAEPRVSPGPTRTTNPDEQSLVDPCAVDVLKKLGGYSKLVERAIDDDLPGTTGLSFRIEQWRFVIKGTLPLDEPRLLQSFTHSSDRIPLSV